MKLIIKLFVIIAIIAGGAIFIKLEIKKVKKNYKKAVAELPVFNKEAETKKIALEKGFDYPLKEVTLSLKEMNELIKKESETGINKEELEKLIRKRTEFQLKIMNDNSLSAKEKDEKMKIMNAKFLKAKNKLVFSDDGTTILKEQGYTEVNGNLCTQSEIIKNELFIIEEEMEMNRKNAIFELKKKHKLFNKIQINLD